MRREGRSNNVPFVRFVITHTHKCSYHHQLPQCKREDDAVSAISTQNSSTDAAAASYKAVQKANQLSHKATLNNNHKQKMAAFFHFLGWLSCLINFVGKRRRAVFERKPGGGPFDTPG